MHACMLTVMLQVYNKLRQHTRGLLWFLAGMELKTVQKVRSSGHIILHTLLQRFNGYLHIFTKLQNLLHPF